MRSLPRRFRRLAAFPEDGRVDKRRVRLLLLFVRKFLKSWIGAQRAFRHALHIDARLPSDSVSCSTGKLEIVRIADAHPDSGKRFVVHIDEILTAFLELESET